ncbi:hypothetical protein FQR65_LT15598 [Abscondita terminalis]|nr:hypothetical protein FQR65_LT15598 [Abscondita terminalis]
MGSHSRIPVMEKPLFLAGQTAAFLLTFSVGASLAVSGGVLQAVFRNPIVDPFSLGISSGAAFGAALSMTGLFLIPLNLPLLLFGESGSVNQAQPNDDLNHSRNLNKRLYASGTATGQWYAFRIWLTVPFLGVPAYLSNLGEPLESIEGPGASCSGYYSGGTINMVTKKPLDKEPQYEALIFCGHRKFPRPTGYAGYGGPLDSAKRVLYRLNVGYENSRTFRDVNQRKSILVAPSFSFRPAEGTTMDVDLTYDNFDGYLDRGLFF